MSVHEKVMGLQAVLCFDNWPMLLLARVFDRKAGFVVYRKKGIDILIDHRGGDQTGTRLCIATGMYSKFLPLLSFRQALRVLDIGANGGGFSLMLKLAGMQFERLVCVEMNPLTYARLALNIATNIGPAASTINAAISGMPAGSEILLERTRGGTGDSIYTKGGVSAPRISVSSTTLQALYDMYFRGHLIDICKIDVEGAEYETLDSCSDQLLRTIRYLFIEFHDPARTPQVLERLAHLGFEEIVVKNTRAEGVHGVHVFRGSEIPPHTDTETALRQPGALHPGLSSPGRFPEA